MMSIVVPEMYLLRFGLIEFDIDGASFAIVARSYEI